MTDLLLGISLVLLVANLVLLVASLFRRVAPDFSPLQSRFESLQTGQERMERLFREEIIHNREESSALAKQAREELGAKLASSGDSLQTRLADIAGLQQKQLNGFAQQLASLTQNTETRLDSIRIEAAQHAKEHRDEIGTALKGFNDSVLKGMSEMSSAFETKFEVLRNVVDAKLREIQADNAKQLDQMRATVDEKLQSTLEKRLGESFKQVSERLEQVHKGLGEMQSLATGVGDLKRVLTNVKTRGGWGEVQLGALLEQVLTPEQYERNVKTKETSNEIVEYAIKLPGRGENDGEVVWLPIDAKFPVEDYQRLVEAQEKADLEGAEEAGKMLTNRIKACAKDISDKYLNPPKTTDFGIMFLPTEGLYAEVIRRAGVIEIIQRESRVVVAGPTTLHAILNSLQMGFRTLVIQKRSGEVWKLLGAVKNEFGKFGDLMDGVKKKLDQASNTMDDVAQKSRTIERKLRNVQELPAADAQILLGEANTPPGPDEV